MLAFQFTFHADVWGTVSDWVMIVVTIATAIAIFLTLKSQKEVQNTQNRLFEIEHIRLREDYKPEFRYSRFYGEANAKPNQFPISIAAQNISDKAARNLSIKLFGNENILGYSLQSNTQNMIKGSENAKMHFLFGNWDVVYRDGFGFTLHYEDLVGTKYRQTVVCHFSKTVVLEFNPSAPEIVT
ncbi:MAG TPA: hypothetical protein VFE53_02385 [Mucilaginibacter sp.]|jgi:hypothetical protein|nr:hypothetical protein [Mucilaginibacter sp.]